MERELLTGVTIFKPGDKVRAATRYGVPGTGLREGVVYVVAAVAELANPDALYIDSFYCDWYEKWKWARGMTRLQAAGHPQRLFFDEFQSEAGFSPDTLDPEGKNRKSFSDAWFVLAEQSK